MKRTSTKTLSFLMALVVMFSTMSFTINLHYCGDTLAKASIFEKTLGCGMEAEHTSAENCSVTRKNCCNDKLLIVEGQDELKISVPSIRFEKEQHIATLFYTSLLLFIPNNKKTLQYRTYKPPLVTRKLYKLEESYLI